MENDTELPALAALLLFIRYSTRPSAALSSPSAANRAVMGTPAAEDNFRWSENGGGQPVAQPLMYTSPYLRGKGSVNTPRNLL